jgi:molecular chaperone DnaK (HSP70)
MAYRSDDGVVVDVDIRITRAEFDDMIEPFVATTLALTRRALEGQNLSPADISDVLLVGGGTLTRKVYESVEQLFGADKVRRNINPMECVALGAGVLAGTLHGAECPSCEKVNDESAATCESCSTSLANARTVGDTGVHEVTGMALGIAAVQGSRHNVFVPIIPRGTAYPLPEPKRQSFRTTDSRLIRVPVYEGDDPVASRNHEQGVVRFELPQEIEVGAPVDVTFNYDANRIVTVTISVPGTDMVKETTLDRDTPRTPAPVDTREDEPDERADWRGDLVFAVEQTDEFLKRYGQYLQHGQEAKIKRDVKRAQDALEYGDDNAEFRRMADLLVTHMYSNSGLASQLVEADLARRTATAERAQQIDQAVKNVERSFRQGNREQVSEQARLLKVLVAKTFSENEAVSGVHGSEDFDGLLEVMKGALGS